MFMYIFEIPFHIWREKNYHRPVESHWQTLLHKVHLAMNGVWTHNVSGNCTGSWKSNYHTITTHPLPYLYGGILSSCISLTFRKCHIPVHNLIIINLVGLTRSTTKSFMSFISVVAVTASKSYTKLLVGQFSIVLLMLVHSFIQSPSFFEAAYTDQEQTFKFLFKFFLNKIRQWISIMMSDFDL